MALLTEGDRVNVWTDFMSALSSAGQSTSLLKSDIKAAVDAADAWVNANNASYNNSLPANVRTGLNSSQKALILLYVITKRYICGV